MSEVYFQHTFENGLTLLCEKMPVVQSVAMTFRVPAGSATDPVDRCGSATVLSDLVLRGAGDRDSRQLTDYLDMLGLHRGGGPGIHHTRFGCAGVGPKVLEGLSAHADIVRRPKLPEDGFQAVRDQALQALSGVEDEPRHKLMIKLREWHLPTPFGRNTMGEKEHLEMLTLASCKLDFVERYQPHGAILSFAGNIDFDRVLDEVEKLFGDWRGHLPPPLTVMPPAGHAKHVMQPSEQTHIGIAYSSIPETHEDYYTMRLAIEILGGGMSGRLFTEIREKRGLVYDVSAGFSSLKGYGSIFGYAGTSNERAQETLDCFVQELYRLQDGVMADELNRAKIGLKADQIMQGESSSARAGAIAHDFFMRGRIRTLDEIKAAIDGVTLDKVNAWLKTNKPGPFTIVTVGPKELKIPA